MLQIVEGIVIGLWGFLLGLAVIAFGQLLLAIREISLNTRKEGKAHPHYGILLVAAKINNVLGWIVLILGVAIGVYVAINGLPVTLASKAQF